MASGLLGRRDLRPPGEPASRRAPERRGRRHADPYDGLDAHRPDGPPFNLCLDPHPSGLPADTLPPQLDQLVALVRASGRAPDAVVITIGANDTSWAGIAEGCYKAFLGVNCLSHRDAIKASLKPEGRPPGGEPNLAERYAMLAAALNHLTEVGLLRPHRVWITDYWDATRDDRNGLWVSKLGLGYARACPPDDPVPGIEAPTPGPGLRRFAHLHIIKPLNAAVRRAAKAHGWHLIGGIGREFARGRHGLCSTDEHRWIRTGFESIQLQADANGAWHANGLGQGCIAHRIVNALAPKLDLRAHA